VKKLKFVKKQDPHIYKKRAFGHLDIILVRKPIDVLPSSANICKEAAIGYLDIVTVIVCQWEKS
jgi:hypothetical protein